VRGRVPGRAGIPGNLVWSELGIIVTWFAAGIWIVRRQPIAIRAGICFTAQTAKLTKRMTKQQLIEKVAAKTELKKSEVEVAVDSVLAMIAEALQANERVDLRGFGSFVVKDRKERQGRNPRTGETITIAAKRGASFKPGKELTQKLAQGETAPTPEEAG
jgi:nucleoid DNA-binding protein